MDLGLGKIVVGDLAVKIGPRLRSGQRADLRPGANPPGSIPV
jgi:hypothetical protein